jgi:hypothetical protein
MIHQLPRRLRAARQRIDNQLSVKSAVLDKYLAGMPPSDHHAGQKNPRHIAL